MLKALEGLGTLAQVFEKVLGIFQTVEARDRQENFNTSLAIVQKIIQIPGGKITYDSQKGTGKTFLFTWSNQSDG